MKINNKLWDFSGRPVVKNLPSKAGDAGSIPGSGTKIPHAVRPEKKKKKESAENRRMDKQTVI